MEQALIAGLDEAGRGPLAGPVVAAAVILPPEYRIVGLTDSKKLTERQRERLFDEIIDQSTAHSITIATVEEIDQINILQASLLAMQRAIEQLAPQPTEVIVDGNQLPRLRYPARAIVKGDLTEPAISAASILAKVSRDRMMVMMDEQYPEYGFARHKGYPTAAHIAALQQYGVTPIHRKSFGPVSKILSNLDSKIATKQDSKAAKTWDTELVETTI